MTRIFVGDFPSSFFWFTRKLSFRRISSTLNSPGHKFPQPANSTLSSLVPPQVTVNFWKRGQLFYNSYFHIISKKSNPKALSQNICWCHGGFPLACKSFYITFIVTFPTVAYHPLWLTLIYSETIFHHRLPQHSFDGTGSASSSTPSSSSVSSSIIMVITFLIILVVHAGHYLMSEWSG